MIGCCTAACALCTLSASAASCCALCTLCTSAAASCAFCSCSFFSVRCASLLTTTTCTPLANGAPLYITLLKHHKQKTTHFPNVLSSSHKPPNGGKTFAMPLAVAIEHITNPIRALLSSGDTTLGQRPIRLVDAVFGRPIGIQHHEVPLAAKRLWGRRPHVRRRGRVQARGARAHEHIIAQLLRTAVRRGARLRLHHRNSTRSKRSLQ